ncbi:MAG: PepSY-associated TM helix domain-containing protein [Bacteroidota bacterium]
MKLFSNKSLFKIHGWLGLNIGLLLFVICFSGTFATLSNEIDWLLDPAVRVEAQDQPIAWEAMYQNLRKEFPDAKSFGLMEQKNSFTEVGDYFAAAAMVTTSNGETLKVHFNPYTGVIQGYNPFLDVQRFFRSYHNNFFDGSRGVYVVTTFAFFLLFSVLTGFLFYKKWLKNLFRLRRDKGLRVLFADAHRMAGIWSLLFALLIALTGVWYFTEKMIYESDNAEILRFEKPKSISESEVCQLGDTPTFLSLDTYVRNAELAFPGFRVEGIWMPRQPNGYVEMDGQDSNPLTRDRTNKVYAHPFTGEVVHIQRAGDLPLLQLINNVVDPLHFGTFGGLAVKILWFVFGLVLSISILAGTYLWYLRHTKKLEGQIKRQQSSKKRSQPTRKVKVPAALAGFSTHSWGVGRGALISAGIILFYLISTGVATVTDGFRIWSGHPEGHSAPVDSTQLGAWPIELECTYPCTLEEETTKLIARFGTEGIANYDSLYLHFYTSVGDTLGIPFGGAANLASLTVSEEVANANITGIQLLITSHDGQTWSRAIDLSRIATAADEMQLLFPNPPEPMYPPVPIRVYVVAGLFSLLTAGIITGWTILIIRAMRKEQQLLALIGN